MGDLTAHMPKCMVSVAGRTLLDWQLSALRAAGVREIGLVTGYRADDIRADDLTEFTNREWATSNMVRSLTCAGPWLVGADTVVIVKTDHPVVVLITCLMADRDMLAQMNRQSGNGGGHIVGQRARALAAAHHQNRHRVIAGRNIGRASAFQHRAPHRVAGVF